MLRRGSAGGALWGLGFYGEARNRRGRPLFSALGIFGRVYWAIAAGDPNVHRAAGWDCAHAARAISHLYIFGIVAVVPGPGLSWDEARRELARTGKIFSQVRRGHWSRAGRGCGLFCVESLAEPDRWSAVGD